MISLVRVDDRLVHGQVTVGWAPYLKATRILVVNDALAGNSLLARFLRTASSPKLKIEVADIVDAARAFRENHFEDDRLIILFDGLKDARRALDAGLEFAELNIGGLRKTVKGMDLGDAVTLAGDDSEILKELRRRGVKVEIRPMPADRPVPLPEGVG